MTEYGAPFDGLLVGDASVAPYSATEWTHIWKLMHGVSTPFPNFGVFKGSGDATHPALEVRATTIVSSNVEVQIGAGLVDGRFYENTAANTLAVAANASGNPRIDTVILRLDYTAQTVRLVVKQGTPAGSPVPPTLQQDASNWEIPLADIAVANGFATLAQSTITQRQRYIHSASAGWQPYALPLDYAIGATYVASTNLPANGGALAIPIVIAGNMLFQTMAMQTKTISTNFAFGFDLYKQDNNDVSSTPYNILRRVAATTTNSGALPGAESTIQTSCDTPVLLPPGLYWGVIQNRHATNALTISSVATGSFSHGSGRTKTLTNPNGDTIDFSVSAGGWSAFSGSVAMFLRGIVFGEAAVY